MPAQDGPETAEVDLLRAGLQLRPTPMAEKGVMDRAGATSVAGGLRGLVLEVDYNIADVRNPCERIREDENGILPVDSINQEEQGAYQAQPPKRYGNDDLLAPFGNDPLHEEP